MVDSDGLKVLVVSQYWYPENGVPQRRWTWLSQILTNAGYEVTVIAPPPHYQRKLSLREWWTERKEARPENVPGPSGETIVRSGFIPEGNSLTLRALNQASVALGMVWLAIRKPAILQGYRPDIVIGTVPALPTSVVAATLACLYRAPYLIDLRDAWPDLLQEANQWNRGVGEKSMRERVLSHGPLQLVTRLTRIVIDRVLENSNGILVTADYLRRQLHERPAIQRRGKKISTIRNVFPPKTPVARKPQLSTAKNSLNVLYAGTLGRAQNLANAIEAANIVASIGININLRLVGAGAARDSLTELICNSGRHVSIENRRPADDLADYYSWADTALVHLTDWEPLTRVVPSKTYELMEIGIHISGAVAGEAADLISSLEAGDVVPPESPEKLARLWIELAQNPERLKVSTKAAEWVARERSQVAPPRLLTAISRAAFGRKG